MTSGLAEISRDIFCFPHILLFLRNHKKYNYINGTGIIFR